MNSQVTHDRGVLIDLARKWILNRYGTEGIEKVSGRLSDRTGEVFHEPTPHKWYELAVVKELYSAINEEFETDSTGMFYELGRFIAENSASGFLKFLTRMLSQDILIQRSPVLWKKYHDGGEIVVGEIVKSKDRKQTKVTVKGYDVGPHSCSIIGGFLSVMVEMAGGSDVKVEHISCINKGQEDCIWLLNWFKKQ